MRTTLRGCSVHDADARIVDRDPRLPGLRVLLDPDAFTRTLRRLAPGLDILGARPRYIRYKPGTSGLAAYAVDLPSGPVGVYARCHREDLSFKVDNAHVHAAAPGPLGPGLLSDPDAALAVFTFPNDYEIRSLRKVLDHEGAPTRLRRIIPGHAHLHQAKPELIRYKPERRFVGRLASSGQPGVALRLYPEQHFAAARERAWAFHDEGPLHVPRVVGDSARYSALAHEWIEAAPLTPLLEGSANAAAVLAGVGAALVGLHRQRPRLREMYSPDDHARLVRGACEVVAILDPSLGERAHALREHLQPALAAHRWRCHGIHGDLAPDQVLVADGRTTLLDFDRAGYGDRCMDLGAFVARLRMLGLAGRVPPHHVDAHAAAFTDAYWHAAGTPEPATARCFVAASLLMTAPEPFRLRHDHWPERIAAVLDAAERTLLGATVGA